MAQNREIGELGQIVTVDTSANSLTVNGSIILGNSSSNVVINSTAISIGGITQTDRSYTWTNTHTFTNTVSIAALSANGSLGISSQVLTTNGTGIYWSSAGVNTNATYTWSNAHTFNGVVTFAQTAIGTVNNSLYLNGTSLATLQGQITSNASAAYTNAVSYTDSKILTANSAITGNAATAYTNAVSYTDNKILTANSAITGNASTAYTNAVSYTDSKILTANSAITGNATTAYTNATIFASNASNINSGTLVEARLPYRMDQNVRTTDTITLGNLTLTGNLYVGSNVNIIGSNNLSIVDNLIYLNANNTVANPDLGFAGNYNDGVYHHAGFFRDASDGIWKVFDNYGPEPDANSYIDTTNTTFHVANFQANTLYAGNTSTNWFIANTGGAYLTGTVNAASYTIGTSTIANSTGVYTGVVNGSSFTVGSSFIANSTGVYSGVVNGSSITVGTAFTANATVVNAVSYYAGTTLIGNTTGPYGKTEITLNVNSALTANNSTNLGGTAAASYQLNSTLNANIASYLPTYTGVVNGSSHDAGSAFVGNTTGLFVNGVISLAGSNGTAGYLLTSNGNSNAYWAAAPAGVNTAAQYTWSNTQTFSNTITFSSTINGTANNATNLGGTASSSYRLKSDGQVVPTGTVEVFRQTAAPTGWTKVVTYNDYAMRIVSGTVSSGGTVAFSTAFASQSVSGTVGSTTLATSQIPSHAHGIHLRGNQAGYGGHVAVGDIYNDFGIATITEYEGGGGSHSHTFSGTAINLAVNYLDFILATAN